METGSDMETMSEVKAESKQTKNWLVWAGSILGILASLYLVYHHISIETDPSKISFCSMSDYVNCDKVAQSEYSELFGVPIASFGLLFFILVLFAPRLSKSQNLSESETSDILCFLSVIGLLASLIYAAISLLVIGALCIVCTAVYVASILVFSGVYFQRKSLLGQASILGGFERGFGLLFGAFSSSLSDSFAKTGAILGASALFLLGTASFDSADQVLQDDPLATAVVEEWKLQPRIALQTRSGESFQEQVFSKGPAAAKIEVVEYADFECPACKRMSTQLSVLLKEFPNELRLVFKNFPLSKECNRVIQGQGHKFACQAAKAARCAGAQSSESFWRVHDDLMKQSSLDETYFEELAISLGLNREAFGACFKSGDKVGIELEVEEALKAGVRSTPSLFVNGKKIKRLSASIVRKILKELPSS